MAPTNSSTADGLANWNDQQPYLIEREFDISWRTASSSSSTLAVNEKVTPLIGLTFGAESCAAIIPRFTELQSYYTPWVKFLFWTGCRPEEATALKWEYIRPDFSEIHFKVSRRCDTQKEQTTKNKRDSGFPCNPRLANLLREQHPGYQDLALCVLPGVSSKPMEYHNFQTRHWKPIVEDLVKERQVFEYMSQYHCRHT